LERLNRTHIIEQASAFASARQVPAAARHDGDWVKEEMVLEWLHLENVRISPEDVENIIEWQVVRLANAIAR